MYKNNKRQLKNKTTPGRKPAGRKVNWAHSLTNLRAAVLAGSVLLAIGLGLAIFEILSTWRVQQTTAATVPLSEALKSNSITPEEKVYISGTPVRITIPSVNIDLEVIPGNYYPANNSWTLTSDKAQWGTITQPANDKEGMTFIYAHYRKGVFLTLPKIKAGEVAQGKTDKGNTFTYTFRSSTITTPKDTSIFAYQGQPILILQTCTGAWYQDRQLFVFDLTKVE